MIEDRGFRLFPGRLDEAVQRALVDAVFDAAADAPFYSPVSPGGQDMRFV